MRKVEIRVVQSQNDFKDKVTGLGLELEELNEDEQISQLEILFKAVLQFLYSDSRYQLEITERE